MLKNKLKNTGYEKMIGTFKAGIVQFDVRIGKIDDNVDQAIKGISDLAVKGAAIAVLPEMWSSGFDNEHLVRHAKATPDILAFFQKLAREKQIAIAGSMPSTDPDGVKNTLYLIDSDGSLKASYSKIHLFSPGNEHHYFSPGTERVIGDLAIGKTGLLTCYDIRFPELSRSLCLDGSEILIVAAQWPMVRIKHWDALLKARAIENQVFVLAANRCGSDPYQEYAGHSMILSPWGDVLGSAGNDEALVVSDIAMDDLSRAREAIPCYTDRRPSTYGVNNPK